MLLSSNLTCPIPNMSHTKDNIPLQMLGGMQIPYRLYNLKDQDFLTLPYMEVQDKAFCHVNTFDMALKKETYYG